MDISTLAAASESFKALFAIAKVATSAAVDHELKSRLIDIQQCILDGLRAASGLRPICV
jgi:hypothetical protein